VKSNTAKSAAQADISFGEEPPSSNGQLAQNSSSTATVTLAVGIPSHEDVANYLIKLAAAEDEPDYLTHLRLQKLMYYVQAWSLARRGRPAFKGRIEAWAHGPVVKELWKVLSARGSTPLPVDALCGASTLSKDDAGFVASVWNAYRGFTAFALRSMTHNESPWINARGGIAPADSCSTEITHEAMREYFSKQG
jgi:uncharacterized phage-associated protein